MGHKLSKIPSGALDQNRHSQAIRRPKATSTSTRVSTIEDTNGSIMIVRCPTPDLEFTASIDGPSAELASKVLAVEPVQIQKSTKAAPSLEGIENRQLTAMPPSSSSPSALEVSESEDTQSHLSKLASIEEAVGLLARQIFDLKSDHDSGLQLCKCEMVSCQAAYVLLSTSVKSLVRTTASSNTLQAIADQAQKSCTKA